MNYFLGVDAGGTKTRAVVIDENAKILGEAVGGPANYHNEGLPQAAGNVTKTITKILDRVKPDLPDIAWCTIGIASCNTPKDYERLFKAFSSGKLKHFADRLTVVNDTKIGLYCGTLPPGIVVVAGTGCNVYGINSHDEEALSGDWDHFFGDKGSGYQLGQWVFQTVIEEYDGRGDPTLLTRKLKKRLGVKSVVEIVDWYNDTLPSIHEVSDFAPLVVEAAEEGDEVARHLLDKSVKELGKALMAVAKRLKVEEEYNRVVIVGGLFENKYFRVLFEGHVTALLKRVRVVKPLVPPAVGAAIMARAEWEKSKK